MNAEKFAKIKFHGLSWVIVLSFGTLAEANSFAENEGLNVTIPEGNNSAIARIDE